MGSPRSGLVRDSRERTASPILHAGVSRPFRIWVRRVQPRLDDAPLLWKPPVRTDGLGSPEDTTTTSHSYTGPTSVGVSPVGADGGGSAGAALDNLEINAGVTMGTYATFDVSGVCAAPGKSVLFHKNTLEAIGGWPAWNPGGAPSRSARSAAVASVSVAAAGTPPSMPPCPR